MLSQDEFALFCKKIDDESILANLCVEPWNSEQLSSILDMLQHIVPTNSKFNLDGKDKLFDFIESSQDIQWLWSESNPKAILYFSECGEVLAVVLQKLKSILSQDKFVSICKEFLSKTIDNESIVQLLSVEPYSANQSTSLWDLLKLQKYGKEKMIEHLTDSHEDHWKWIRTNPDEILSFSDDGDIFTLVLKKGKQINAPMNKFSASKKYSNGNTMLHILSKDPLSDTQMDIVMTILQQEDVRPDELNSDGKTFLSLSQIHPKLLQRIHTAPNVWATKVFDCCIANPEVLVSWIELGNDILLEAIFDRLSQSLLSIKKPVRKLFRSRNYLQ